MTGKTLPSSHTLQYIFVALNGDICMPHLFIVCKTWNTQGFELYSIYFVLLKTSQLDRAKNIFQ